MAASQEVDEIISASWIVPVDTDDVLRDHSIAVKDGKIHAIFPTNEADGKFTAKVVTNLRDQVLLPGLVNAHTHSPMVYMRGVSDDIPLKQWLETVIWPLEGHFLGPEFVRDGCELAILEMLLGGTTTFNDMYWFPENLCEAVQASGIRAAVSILVIEFPFGDYGSGPDDFFRKGREAREMFLSEPRISWTVSLHAPYTCSEATMIRAKDLSARLDVPVCMHLHETPAERDDSIAQRKDGTCHISDQATSPVANLRRLGLLNSKLIAVHMVELSDEEISWVASEGTSVVHCPASNLKLASGFCRVADLHKAGVNVALGTDGASSNNNLDMLSEMRLAAMLAKAVARDATAVPALAALRMATLNGAKALGLEAVTGSLTVGKEADLIAVDFSSPSTWPVPNTTGKGFDPVTHVVYSSTRDQVTNVWVSGRQLVKDRKPTTLDLHAIRAKADKWGAQVTKYMNK